MESAVPKARAGRSVAPVSVLHELAKIMLNARGGGWKGGFVKRERKEKEKEEEGEDKGTRPSSMQRLPS